MTIILYVLYVLVGILLAIPYCILAGWNTESFMVVVFAAPAFVFIWFVLAGFAGVLEVGHGERRICLNWRAAFRKGDRLGLPGSLVVFWIWTLYSLLPILVHWSAVLLNGIGFVSVGMTLDAHRYASWFYIFMATMALCVLIGMTHSAWEAMKNGWND